MSSPYRTLDRAALRAETERLAFAGAAPQRDAFGLELELLPFVGGSATERVQRVGPLTRLSDGGTLRDLVERVAAPVGVPVEGTSERDFPPASGGENPSFAFGLGGQLVFRSGASARPAEAYTRCVEAIGRLEARLGVHGVRLIGMGADPWSDAEQVDPQDGSATAACLEIAQPSREARDFRRLCAGLRVCVGFGSAVAGAERLRCALSLADAAEAAFGFSPLALGAVSGIGGLRAARRRGADPLCSRALPRGASLDEWIDHALAARVLIVRGAEKWYAQARELPFGAWMERGLRGSYPDLEDWRAHLASLDLGVRANGWIEIDVHDSQARAFWSVPLVLWSALLCDGPALARSAALPAGDPLERARAAFALAADALLRSPAGWHSPEMLAAFVEFARRFACAGRTPSDDLLSFLSRRRSFGPTEYLELERLWAKAAGLAPARVD